MIGLGSDKKVKKAFLPRLPGLQRICLHLVLLIFVSAFGICRDWEGKQFAQFVYVRFVSSCCVLKSGIGKVAREQVCSQGGCSSLPSSTPPPLTVSARGWLAPSLPSLPVQQVGLADGWTLPRASRETALMCLLWQLNKINVRSDKWQALIGATPRGNNHQGRKWYWCSCLGDSCRKCVWPWEETAE